MEPKPDWLYNQSAVIPFRRENGELRILLITTLKSKKWIVPKGVIEPDLSPAESAEIEAYEEAGIKGKVYKKQIGKYRYRKWGGVCTVKVYLLEVKEILEEWPESELRERKWMSLRDAAELVKEKTLKPIITNLQYYIDKAGG